AETHARHAGGGGAAGAAENRPDPAEAALRAPGRHQSAAHHHPRQRARSRAGVLPALPRGLLPRCVRAGRHAARHRVPHRAQPLREEKKALELSVNLRAIFSALTVLVLVLFYCLYAWQKAAVADTVSTALARLIIDKVPGVRAQKRFDVNAPPVSSPADVGFGSTGTGSPGGCTYWLLRNCVALQIDASVNRKP